MFTRGLYNFVTFHLSIFLSTSTIQIFFIIHICFVYFRIVRLRWDCWREWLLNPCQSVINLYILIYHSTTLYRSSLHGKSDKYLLHIQMLSKYKLFALFYIFIILQHWIKLLRLECVMCIQIIIVTCYELWSDEIVQTYRAC